VKWAASDNKAQAQVAAFKKTAQALTGFVGLEPQAAKPLGLRVLDRGLFRPIALDVLLGSLSLIEQGEKFRTDGYCQGTHAGIGIGARGWPMSIADQFWQYAKEAILSAAAAKTDDDRQSLLELAQTWTQAALQERQCTPSSVLISPGARGTRHVY